MEGEENKLTTFFTWAIMLGCNESSIIFQQHLCKLGQLRRSNPQVFGQAMKKRPTGYIFHMDVTVRRMTKHFVQRCQSIYVYMYTHTHTHSPEFRLKPEAQEANRDNDGQHQLRPEPPGEYQHILHHHDHQNRPS